MCLMRTQHWCVIFGLCLLLFAAGCRNRSPYCQPCYSAGPFDGILGSTTVAPPATYSLQIPGAQNQPYYNGSATAQQLPAIQTTGTLPPANSGNLQNGWQPAGTTVNTINTLPVSTPTSVSSSTNQVPNSGINSQAGLVSVIDRNRSAAQNRVAQNSTLQNGLSFTNDMNFRSTAVDERLDQSRLPVTDASQVRAPTNFSPSTTVGQFTAPYYNPNQNQLPYGYQQQYQVAQNPYANQRLVQVPIQNPNLIAGQQNVVVGNFAQPTFAQPPRQIYRGLTTQNPQVLAQSTVYADPANDSNFQNGWRDRDLTAARDSFNR